MNFFDLIYSKTFLLFLGFCYFLYKLITRNNDYFIKRGIKFIKPVPFFGNLAQCVFQKKNFAEVFVDAYNEFPKER